MTKGATNKFDIETISLAYFVSKITLNGESLSIYIHRLANQQLAQAA